MSGDQFGFDAMLENAARENAARVFDRETAHLPTTWEDGLAYHKEQITQHHAAMLKGEIEAAVAIREEAHKLAIKLNGGHGILAGNDAAGCRLGKATAAKDGDVPMWGQDGRFVTEAMGMQIAVEMGGMFNIGATSTPFSGFSVCACDPSRPFLSETGYRSFLGVTVSPENGMTTERFVQRVVAAHVGIALNGKLLRVDPKYFEGK